jgi:hypothetical protein
MTGVTFAAKEACISPQTTDEYVGGRTYIFLYVPGRVGVYPFIKFLYLSIPV